MMADSIHSPPAGMEQRLILEEFKSRFFDHIHELNRCIEFPDVPIQALLHTVIEDAMAWFRQPPLSAAFRNGLSISELISILVPQNRGSVYCSHGLPPQCHWMRQSIAQYGNLPLQQLFLCLSNLSNKGIVKGPNGKFILHLGMLLLLNPLPHHLAVNCVSFGFQ